MRLPEESVPALSIYQTSGALRAFDASMVAKSVCIAILVWAALLVSASVPAGAHAKPTRSYEQRKSGLLERQAALSAQWKGSTQSQVDLAALEAELVSELEFLADFWVGSTWGRGNPQSSTPQRGKINCGTFVGTLLRDIGFTIDVKTLQRQASQGIIRSFVGGKRVRKFSGASMKRFLASVKEMGPGLYIIGLDLHVGLLIQNEDELLYMHSSSETGKVAKELAMDAWTIQSSNYRVVGKILSRKNLRFWLTRRRVEVKGNS